MFHILVVEDDQALNKLICRVLNKNGYDLFDAILNRVHGSLPHGISLDQKLIELFNLVTYELVKNKLKLM